MRNGLNLIELDPAERAFFGCGLDPNCKSF